MRVWLGVVAVVLAGCGADGSGGGSTSVGAAPDAAGPAADALPSGRGTDVLAADDASTPDTTAVADTVAADASNGGAPDAPLPADVPDPPADTSVPPEDVGPPAAAYQTVDVPTLAAWLDANDDVLLINVHVPYAGEIPGTDAHISYLETALLMAKLGDKGRKAVLYCLTGPMSYKAAHDLVAAGYWNVYDLPAAMVGWKAAGKPFTDP